ncbi:hypothetical protein JCM5353_004126 [Sporobolomyces roseus]
MQQIPEHSPFLPSSSSSSPPFFPPHSTSSSSSSSNFNKLLTGFCTYSIASEIWVIAAGTLFLPVVIETYARSNGKLDPDHHEACLATGEGQGEEVVRRCAVRVLGVWLDTASFSLIVYSLSVAVQALTVISIGSLANDPLLRYRFLTAFATLGSLASILFYSLPSTSIFWPLCTLFALLANVSFGAAGVCLNSYLPSLARLSPLVTTSYDTLQTSLKSPSSSSSTNSHQLLVDYTRLRSQETSRISSKAIAMGYAAGIGVLIGLLPIVRALTVEGGDETWPLRVAIGISGGLWLIGTIVAAGYLKPIPSSPSPNSRSTSSLSKMDLSESIKSSWRGLGRQLREWRRLPNTFRFLSAWFLLSDSFATLTSTAMLFAKTTLNLPVSSLILIAILTPLSGILGALLFPCLQRSLPHPHRASNHQILLLLVLLSSTIPLWGLLSLKSQTELYFLSVYFGALYGSFQSYSRSCFSELIPESQGASWFGLYSITDKSSSFLGPLLVSLITNLTGEIRHGFWLILGFFWLSLPILRGVDMEKGSKDADSFERELEREGMVDNQGELYGYTSVSGEEGDEGIVESIRVRE